MQGAQHSKIKKSSQANQNCQDHNHVVSLYSCDVSHTIPRSEALRFSVAYDSKPEISP